MKKWIAVVMTVLFFACCLFPVWGRVLPGANRPVENENRLPTKFPGRETGLTQWPKALEDWFGDRLAFRREAVDFVGWINNNGSAGLEAVNDVLRGKNGYLFFMGDGSKDDLTLHKALTPDQLTEIHDAQEETVRQVNEAGAEYLLLICPDKQTIYPEFLPDAMPLATWGESRLDQILNALDGIGQLHIADTREALRAAKNDYQLFYLTDTHWSNLGAWTGYQEAARSLEKLGIGFHALTEEDVEIGPATKRKAGDMAVMLGENDAEEWTEPVSVKKPEARKVKNTYSKTLPGYKDLKIRIFENPEHPELPRAVIFHDSFCSAMRPFLAEGFSRVVFISTSHVYMDFVLIEQPDVVIQEYVERMITGTDQMPESGKGKETQE